MSGHVTGAPSPSFLNPRRLFAGLAVIVSAVSEAIGAWRRYQELDRLSPGQLRARGLTRGDIAREAVFGATERR